MVKTRNTGIVDTGFPDIQFNHCIACIPGKSDTTWLETTSDNIQYGETLYIIEGCSVLLVDSSGGKIVSVKQSSAEENSSYSFITGKIYLNGQFDFSGYWKTTGNQKIYVFSQYQENSEFEFKEWFAIRLGAFNKIDNLEISGITNTAVLADTIIISFKGRIEKFAKITRKRIFFNPNILNRINETDIESPENRTYPLLFNYPYLDHDSLVIAIPVGYKLETVPGKTEINAAKSTYQMRHHFKNDSLYYSRKFLRAKKYIDLENYPDYYWFIQDIMKSDKYKFVFKQI